MTQESLRSRIAMVTQDTSLLHRSIRDNIRYGRPEASDEEVREAAARAHALDFIEGLEDWQGRCGMDAHVGERGVKLSGGQRQRIALARVILKNAPILILDEATSALDSEVEAAIQEQLDDLMKGRTVIAIAHRLSTISRMDRLVVHGSRAHRRDRLACRAVWCAAGPMRGCGAGNRAASTSAAPVTRAISMPFRPAMWGRCISGAGARGPPPEPTASL